MAVNFWKLPKDIQALFGTGEGEHPNRQKVERMWEPFRAIFGRDPTREDVAKYSQYFTDSATGLAALQNAYEQEQQKPSALKGKAGEFGDQVSSQFQSILGRAPDASELEHFGTLMAGDQIDAYTLGEWLKQQPEYTNKQDKAFRGELSGELQGQGEQYFSEKILPSIQSSLLKSGRSQDSSGYAAMLARAAQEQNLQRESFLSNLTASQYMGNKAAARGDYEAQLADWYANKNYGTQRADTLSDRYWNRAQELQNYDIQKRAYDEYLQKMGKRSWVDSLNTGLNMANSFANLFKGWQSGSPVNSQV